MRHRLWERRTKLWLRPNGISAGIGGFEEDFGTGYFHRSYFHPSYFNPEYFP